MRESAATTATQPSPRKKEKKRKEEPIRFTRARHRRQRWNRLHRRPMSPRLAPCDVFKNNLINSIMSLSCAVRCINYAFVLQSGLFPFPWLLSELPFKSSHQMNINIVRRNRFPSRAAHRRVISLRGFTTHTQHLPGLGSRPEMLFEKVGS